MGIQVYIAKRAVYNKGKERDCMALIPLKDYAIRHGRNPANAVQKAHRGTFKTAVKMGRDWFIDEDEPYSDARITSGNYVGWKFGYQYQKNRKEQSQASDQDKPN